MKKLFVILALCPMIVFAQDATKHKASGDGPGGTAGGKTKHAGKTVSKGSGSRTGS